MLVHRISILQYLDLISICQHQSNDDGDGDGDEKELLI
jgi:hypothetical protein